MVVARAKAKAPPAAAAAAAAGATPRRGGVRVGPARLEGLPAAWPAGAAAVKVKWPAPGGALAHMLTGRWARGVTAVEPVAGGGTRATLTLNSFADHGDGGGAASCTGTFFGDGERVVALSTGWFAGGSRCGSSVVIRARNGRSITATVVDECDSLHGCDDEHNFEPPCASNIVDGSPAVWKALGLNTNDGEVPVTWSEA